MFFEVTHSSDSKEYFRYGTRLTKNLSNESIIAFKLKVDWVLHEWDLGDAYYLRIRDIIYVMRMFPYGYEIKNWPEWVFFKSREWRAALLWKWIAWAVEYFILSQFSNQTFLIHDDEEQSPLRRKQLEKYWLRWGWNSTSSYLEALRRSLFSPSFEIERMPPWITNEQKTEILQLREKV